MFSKILGKINNPTTDKNQEHKVLVERISKMNLTDMRAYVNNRVPDFQVDEDGLVEILNKLLEVNDKTSKRYIDIDDMDTKIKKGFDLILSTLTNKKATVLSIELVSLYLESSKEIIEKYDKENKQIYYTKFKDSISLAVDNINARSELERKSSLIGD